MSRKLTCSNLYGRESVSTEKLLKQSSACSLRRWGKLNPGKWASQLFRVLWQTWMLMEMARSISMSSLVGSLNGTKVSHTLDSIFATSTRTFILTLPDANVLQAQILSSELCWRSLSSCTTHRWDHLNSPPCVYASHKPYAMCCW